MQFIIFACLMVVGAFAAPDTPRVIPVLERTEKHDELGQFALRYVSGDGTILSETGALKPTLDGKDHVLVKEGEYTFTAPDGKLYRTEWVADENGYRTRGSQLPKSLINKILNLPV